MLLCYRGSGFSHDHKLKLTLSGFSVSLIDSGSSTLPNTTVIGMFNALFDDDATCLVRCVPKAEIETTFNNKIYNETYNSLSINSP